MLLDLEDEWDAVSLTRVDKKSSSILFKNLLENQSPRQSNVLKKDWLNKNMPNLSDWPS